MKSKWHSVLLFIRQRHAENSKFCVDDIVSGVSIMLNENLHTGTVKSYLGLYSMHGYIKRDTSTYSPTYYKVVKCPSLDLTSHSIQKYVPKTNTLTKEYK